MTQETIIFFIIGSIFAMILGGAGIIGITMVVRPRILLRQRMNQIGVIGTGAAAGSEKSEGRRQKRIQDRIKQLEQKGKKKGRSEALRSEIIQAGLDITVQTYFIISLTVGVFLTFFYLMAGMPLMGAIAAFLIGALSVIGLPPLGGSWSKWYIAIGAMEAQQIFFVGVLMLSSLLNVGYLLPIPIRAFFGPKAVIKNAKYKEAPVACLIAIGISSIGCVLLFFYPSQIYALLKTIMVP